jgi:hypothetical protein
MHKTTEETTHYRAITCVAKQATRRRTISMDLLNAHQPFPTSGALAVGEEEEVAWAHQKSRRNQKTVQKKFLLKT